MGIKRVIINYNKMEKNDPLMESAINILKSLKIYKDNVDSLKESINISEQDKQELENCIEIMKQEAEKESEEIARAWRPYASVASWYCWRSLDKRRVDKSNGDG